MRYFPDTSFLYSAYREQIHSPRADAVMESLVSPLPVSGLLLFEFRNSIRLQQKLFSEDRNKGFSKSEAATMLRDLQTDLRSGAVETVAVDWPDVHRIAEELSAKHTAVRGHRFADILHVATALHLGSELFLSFDDNQRALADAEGMALI